MLKKKSFIIIPLLILLIALGVVLILKVKKPTTKNLKEDEVLVTLTIVPKDAEVFLNDQKVDNPSIVKKGEYTVKIERFGFKTVTFKQKFKESIELPFSLIPVTEETEKWAQENQHLYQAIESMVGQQTIEAGERQRAAAPIINLLPIQRDPYYRIGYTHDEDENITITIHANDETRGYAIDELNQIEPNTANYRYRFYNTQTNTYSDNPFLDIIKAGG